MAFTPDPEKMRYYMPRRRPYDEDTIKECLAIPPNQAKL